MANSRKQLKALAKIVHKLMDIPTDAILKRVAFDCHTQGHTMKFERPTARVDSYLFSFFPLAIKIWGIHYLVIHKYWDIQTKASWTSIYLTLD